MAQELWQIAKPFGRPAKFKSPEELWDAFQRYCEWSSNNPLTVQNTKAQRDGKQAARSQYRQTVERPLSLGSFRLHASIKRQWGDFRKDYMKRSHAFCEVIYAIEEAVLQQQVGNAMVGNYKENLVARINGLAEVTKQEVSGSVNTQQGMSVEKSREFLQQIESEI